MLGSTSTFLLVVENFEMNTGKVVPPVVVLYANQFLYARKFLQPRYGI